MTIVAYVEDSGAPDARMRRGQLVSGMGTKIGFWQTTSRWKQRSRSRSGYDWYTMHAVRAYVATGDVIGWFSGRYNEDGGSAVVLRYMAGQ